MRIRPAEPDWPDRDRFVLSKGHGAPALYAALAERGFWPRELLWTFAQPGTELQKHIDMHVVPGTELSTGSLGQGFSVSVGMALADRLDKKDRWVYVLISDGECQEGQVWEAAMAAAQNKLDRMIAFLDLNGCQVDGYVDDICSLGAVDEKWRGFGWHVQHINGHDIRQILAAIALAQTAPGRPHMIVADTVKGKGISYMENRPEWHSQSISEEKYHIAMSDLDRIEHCLADGGVT